MAKSLKDALKRKTKNQRASKPKKKQNKVNNTVVKKKQRNKTTLTCEHRGVHLSMVNPNLCRPCYEEDRDKNKPLVKDCLEPGCEHLEK